MNSFKDVFEEVKKYCLNELKIPEVAVNLWIASLEPVKLEGNKALLYADSEFQRDTSASNYSMQIEKALTAVLGFPVKVEILVNPKSTPDKDENIDDFETDYDEFDKKHEELENSYKKAVYPYTFDTFIVGRSNEFAYAACKAVASDSEGKMNPLFIYGDSGLGKTHLLMAIKHEYEEKKPKSKVIYVTSEEFGNELISSITRKNTEEFHTKYRNADILLVDDIQFFGGRERMQEEFFHTFNTLYSEGKQIVITSDRPPKEVKTLTDRLRTRFESGLLADISAPDYETRVAIIRRKAQLLNLDIPDDVADFIAQRLKLI